MEFKQELSQTQSQQLVLSQALRQSIEILALSNQELAQRIQREILENPVLEETEDISLSLSKSPETKRKQSRARQSEQ